MPTRDYRAIAKIRFGIPDYDNAMCKLIEQVIDGFMALDPVLGSISREDSLHRGPIRNVRGENPLDQNMSSLQAKASLKLDSVRNSNIDEHTQFLYDFAQSNVAAVAPEFFRGMQEITDVTGNVVDAGGKPFSLDLLNDALEKISIGFDESGEPILPALFVSPDVDEKIKDMKQTAEQAERFSQIVAQKRAQFNAQKRTRRLS